MHRTDVEYILISLLKLDLLNLLCKVHTAGGVLDQNPSLFVKNIHYKYSYN